jgi:hypothetical protein
MVNEKKKTVVETKKKWFQKISDKIKWFFIELLAMYSGKPSYFSKKRVESGIAFIIAQWGMIFFLLDKHSTLSMGEFLLWAAAEFAVSGYIINKIQQEKKSESSSSSSESTEM